MAAIMACNRQAARLSSTIIDSYWIRISLLMRHVRDYRLCTRLSRQIHLLNQYPLWSTYVTPLLKRSEPLFISLSAQGFLSLPRNLEVCSGDQKASTLIVK